jgi:hypothetical protein
LIVVPFLNRAVGLRRPGFALRRRGLGGRGNLLRADCSVRMNALHPVDDHPVARLQTFQNDALTAQIAS